MDKYVKCVRIRIPFPIDQLPVKFNPTYHNKKTLPGSWLTATATNVLLQYFIALSPDEGFIKCLFFVECSIKVEVSNSIQRYKLFSDFSKMLITKLVVATVQCVAEIVSPAQHGNQGLIRSR